MIANLVNLIAIMTDDARACIVQCCKNNDAMAIRELLDDDCHDIRDSFCLQRCGECYDTAFVVVDGDKIEYDREDPPATLPEFLITEGAR